MEVFITVLNSRYTIHTLVKHQLTPVHCASLYPPVFAVAPAPTDSTVMAVPVDSPGVIRVSWSAPTVPSGELPITGYSIQYKERGENPFSYVNDITATTAEVTGLKSGQEYQVYVATINDLGIGDYCCDGSGNQLFVITYRGGSSYL